MFDLTWWSDWGLLLGLDPDVLRLASGFGGGHLCSVSDLGLCVIVAYLLHKSDLRVPSQLVWGLVFISL